MLAIVVRFDLPDAAAAAAFAAALADVLPGIRDEEPGTLRYDVYEVVNAPLARVFHEIYRDRDAHAAHEARPATAAFLARARELVDDIRVELLTPLP